VRKALIGLEVFVGVPAVAGGLDMLLTNGRVLRLSDAFLRGSPFGSYALPGLALAAVVGGGTLAAATGLLRGRVWGVAASALAGAALVVFEVVEVAVMLHAAGAAGFNVQQPLFFAIGLAIFALAARLWSGGPRAHRAAGA
jgi:hypothetical protein